MRTVALIVRAGALVALVVVVVGLLVDGAPRPAAALAAAPVTALRPRARLRRRRAPWSSRSGRRRPRSSRSQRRRHRDGLDAEPAARRGRSFFSGVQADLAGDVVLGNLEGTLSTGGGSKCGPSSTNCFAFQTPPSYARWLSRAGFTVLNLANNHAYDFGPSGMRADDRSARPRRAGAHRAARADRAPEGRRGRGRRRRLRALSVGGVAHGHPRRQAPRREGREARRRRRRHDARRCRGLRPSARPPRHRDLPRREPRRRRALLARGRRRRRRPRDRARPARAARDGVVPRPADRVLARQLRRLPRLRARRAALGQRDPPRDAARRRDVRDGDARADAARREGHSGARPGRGGARRRAQALAGGLRQEAGGEGRPDGVLSR